MFGAHLSVAGGMHNADEVDVVLSDFEFHPVDSPDCVYRGSAGSAFRSAWEAWRRYYTRSETGSRG